MWHQSKPSLITHKWHDRTYQKIAPLNRLVQTMRTAIGCLNCIYADMAADIAIQWVYVNGENVKVTVQ